MDDKKKKKDIVITGSTVGKYACIIGLTAIAISTILSLVNGEEINTIMLISTTIPCIMGFVLTNKKS